MRHVRSVANARELHVELFAAYPEATAKTVSRLEREAKELPNRSLVYGEIPFETLEALIQLARTSRLAMEHIHTVS